VGEKKCIHYWKIDGNDVGTCIYCGEVRDFGAIQRKPQPFRAYPKKPRGNPYGRRGRPKKIKEDDDEQA